MTPKFLLLGDDEKAEWKRHPVTAAFLEYLSVMEAQTADQILLDVARGQNGYDDARYGSATLQAIGMLTVAMDRTRPVPPETADSTFVDPAAIWGDRKK